MSAFFYGNVYKQGDLVKNESSDDLELYFSDGSVSVIKQGTKITLTDLAFQSDTNLKSKVKLFLQAGAIWTKATKLDEDSEFDVFTTDAVAAVRGTIFAVSKDDSKTDITLYDGKLLISVNGADDKNLTSDGTTTKSISVSDSVIHEESEEISLKNSFSLDEDNISGYVLTKPEDGAYLAEYTAKVLDAEGYDYSNIDEKETCEFDFGGYGCESDLNTLGDDDYTLVGYAPYDESGDGDGNLNLYKEENNNKYGKYSKHILGNGTELPYICNVSKSIKGQSFCYIDEDTKGIFIDNTSNDSKPDFLEYSGLDLNSDSDFAIELSVRAVDLNQTGGRYIFDDDDNEGLYIARSSSSYFMKYGGNIICNDSDSSNLNCNFSFSGETDKTKFETIKIKNGENIEIGGQSFDIVGNTISNLYLGSKRDYSLQFNGIIDYLKIYKK